MLLCHLGSNSSKTISIAAVGVHAHVSECMRDTCVPMYRLYAHDCIFNLAPSYFGGHLASGSLTVITVLHKFEDGLFCFYQMCY